MDYKVLIAGKNDAVIDGFFSEMKDSFEALTTSIRYDDIMRHLNYFKPNIFVCCVDVEALGNIGQLVNIGTQLSNANIPFIIIGAKEDCDEFERSADQISNLAVYTPSPANVTKNKILMLLRGRQAFNKPQENPAIPQPFANAVSIVKQPSMQQAEESSDRKHILVVDDSSMMLKMVKEHLHDRYDVATAVSGKIALKFLERKKTDLILLDYEMPDEDGPAVLEKLRASYRTKDIPVVFLTGVTERSKLMNALVLKPQGYLLKPIDREKLRDTVSRIVG